MRDVSDRLREMFDERQRQYQTRINQIYFDRSMRAVERSEERRRAEKAFLKSAAGETYRRNVTNDDTNDDHPRWVSWIPVYAGSLGAAASIWAMIVYGHPPGFLAYAVVTGLGLFAGWIALVLTAWVVIILYSVARFLIPAIVIAMVAGVILLIRHHAS
jgi:hypothetical protein